MKALVRCKNHSNDFWLFLRREGVFKEGARGGNELLKEALFGGLS